MSITAVPGMDCIRKPDSWVHRRRILVPGNTPHSGVREGLEHMRLVAWGGGSCRLRGTRLHTAKTADSHSNHYTVTEEKGNHSAGNSCLTWRIMQGKAGDRGAIDLYNAMNLGCMGYYTR